MKKSIRMTVAALAILGVTAGGFAHAARGDGACDGPRMSMSGKAGGAYLDKRLERLHADLKLTAAQEGAWKTWTDGMKGVMTKMRDGRPDASAKSSLPAPERMAKMLERHQEKQKDMEGVLAATRDFYATLTAEQRKVFDAFKGFGHYGRGDAKRGPGERSGRS